MIHTIILMTCGSMKLYMYIAKEVNIILTSIVLLVNISEVAFLFYVKEMYNSHRLL